MNTNEPRDDEILGRALSRAIETLDAEETPYERSRIASGAQPHGLPLWQLASVAAALVLALAFGTWVARPPVTPEPVAAPPSLAPSATAAVTTAPEAAVPSASIPSGRDSVWVYFTRDSLPPVGAFVRGGFTDGSPESRINARLTLLRGSHDAVPAGAANPLSQVAPLVGGGSTFGVSTRIAGDVATVQFEIPTGWGVRGTAQSRALLQQLVYVITEEPGIRYARIVEAGGTNAVIDGIVVDKPLSRNDVSGYKVRANTPDKAIFAGDDSVRSVGANLVSRVVEDGTRVWLYFEGRDRGANDATASLPTTTITFALNDGTVPHNTADGPSPAYILIVGFQWNSPFSSGGVGHVERVDRSPLRLISTDSNTTYVFGLDDARPWRAYMPDTAHLVVEVGGDPRLLSDRIAVTQPVFDANVGQSFVVSGWARTFEANVVWRVKDNAQKIVATGFTTASLGTNALGGTFHTVIALPPSVGAGKLTLEIYEVSAKDGVEQGLVAIPLNR